MDNIENPNQDVTITAQHPTKPTDQEAQQRNIIIGIVVAVIVFLVITIAAIIWLAQPGTDTAKVRDIFIIFMALESILLGLTLVILIVQLARLINLLQNEIKPILDSTNETVSNLRGTTTFLGDNMVEPIIKLNAQIAAITQAFKVMGLSRKQPKE